MLHALLHYDHDIKELADFKKRYEESHGHIAQILMKHFSDQSHFFLIDIGTRQGIKPDMVAVYKNCLIGKVAEVYPFYSKVVLITDKTCKVAAYCAQTHASGIHEGSNQSEQTMLNHVSHLSVMKEGDLILSSGEGLIFPQGFALGNVMSCKPNGLLYTVHVEPLVDMHALAYCLIIQKGAEAI